MSALDFGWRQYDPQIGRWSVYDPCAESAYDFTPYNYALNDPVNYIDLDGCKSKKAEEEDKDKNKKSSQNELDDKDRSDGSAYTINVNTDMYSVTGERPKYIYPTYNYGFNAATWRKFWVNNGMYQFGFMGGKIIREVNSPLQAVSTLTTWGGIAVAAAQQIVKIPIVGYNIAYNSTLLKSVNYLKPIGYGGTIISVASDYVMSVNGMQSWTETIINSNITALALKVGGWYGIAIQLDYMAAKAYMTAIAEHPEYSIWIKHGR